MFDLLDAAGLEGEPAVEAFQVMTNYTVGFAAFQAPQAEAPPAQDRGDRLSLDHRDETFMLGLNWILDGITAMASTNGREVSRLDPARR